MKILIAFCTIESYCLDGIAYICCLVKKGMRVNSTSGCGGFPERTNRKGGKTMQVNVKKNIAELRRLNFSYACIGEKLGISANTVKSVCRRENIVPTVAKRKTKTEKAGLQLCRYCQKPLVRTSSQHKLFCDDRCRMEYWKKARRKN